ncbi:MAG TPA: PDZ domain-containing protein [Fimbriimonadaceae bacterium]|nr:PDZ domain-containing protein [Fimbriimonadaceae bacterium]
MLTVALAALFLAHSPADPIAVVPFTVSEDAIVVKATVNGKDVSCLFDSGFSGAFVIGPHIDLGKPTGKMSLQDFVGVFDADTIDVSSLKFGGLDLKHDGMLIVHLPTMSYTQAYGTHIDGIMGLEVLSHYVTEINFEKHEFILHPDSYDISAMQPDGKRTFLTKMLPFGMNSIEMAVRASTGKQMVLALDTGNAFYATTHKDVLEDAGLWKSGDTPKFMGKSQVASGVVDTWDYLIKDVKIFGVPVKQSVWSIIDLPSSSAQHNGTVGFQFLKHFNITLDMQRRRVWFDNFAGTTVDPPEGDIGLVALYSQGRDRMVVVDVTPDGPAAKAGIKEGDYLVSVGDENLVQSTYRHVRKILTGPVGSKVDIEVSSEGRLERFTLVREQLVNE